MSTDTSVLGRLREVQDPDLPLMLSWRNTPAVRAFLFTRHHISLQEHTAWWEKARHRKDLRYFIYEVRGVPAGLMTFTAIDAINNNAIWGFYKAPQAPKGAGRNMAFLALDIAFNELACHKLYGEVLALNKPSIRLHEGLGFKLEGIYREHHMIDGQYADVHRFGMLQHEWRDNRDRIAIQLIQQTQEGLHP